VRILGVHCTGKHAFLALVIDGDVVAEGPLRLAPTQSADEDSALWETLNTFDGALDELRPDTICLLLPGTGENARQTHGAWAPRIELETLLRMAAARRDLPVQRLARATVLSRLGLPNRGKFGGYWTAGRLAAAAAALANKEG
jgi:hypothetical protein